ncbi:MAG: hypothetical protein ACC618_02635 [Patescibacteria group bacterium]
MNESRERSQGSKKVANLVTDIPGHETEYVLTTHRTPSSPAEEELPRDWERKIQDKLGEGWSVMDRSGRIEIRPPDLVTDEESDIQVKSALEGVLGSKYDLRESSF